MAKYGQGNLTRKRKKNDGGGKWANGLTGKENFKSTGETKGKAVQLDKSAVALFVGEESCFLHQQTTNKNLCKSNGCQRTMVQ